MTFARTLVLTFAVGLLAGLLGPSVIRSARACAVYRPLAASYDLRRRAVVGGADTRPVWPPTATLDTFGGRIDFSDGTHVVFQ